jgi:hypothetical protein
VLFAVGLALIVNEAILRDGPERPGLLVLYAGMVGLPAVIRAEKAARREGNGNSSGNHSSDEGESS